MISIMMGKYLFVNMCPNIYGGFCSRIKLSSGCIYVCFMRGFVALFAFL